MLLHASALHHPVALALCYDQSPPLRLPCSLVAAAAPPLSATLTAATPPFLITFTLFSLWQNEMGHSAASAFQRSPRADIPLHKLHLIAVSVRTRASQVCMHVLFFTFALCFMIQSYKPGYCWAASQGFKQTKVFPQPRWYQQLQPPERGNPVTSLISSLTLHSSVANWRR